MKFIFIILIASILIFFCSVSYCQTNGGNNPGYYGSQYTDQQIYDLMYASGSRSTRSNVSLQFEQIFGMSTFQTRLQYPYVVKGMRNNVFTLYISQGPDYAGRSDSTTSGGHQTWLTQGLYLPPFNMDGSINTANVFGFYCYNVINSIGGQFTTFEVNNEPDFTDSSNSFLDSTQAPCCSWQNHMPNPDELTNIWASVADYVQMCKIAHLVIKVYRPNALIATGGIGSSWFYQWCLRLGITQWIDVISIHMYPFYGWTAFPSFAMRNSDYLLHLMDSTVASFRQIETQEHATHLPMITTEANTLGWSYPGNASALPFPNNKLYGNSHLQRNFMIKAFVNMLQDSLQQYFFYETGETGDSASQANTNDAMGFYKNLTTTTPGHEVINDEGTANITTTAHLFNYKVNLTPIATLPAGVSGVEFDSANAKAYVIWATCTLDTLETASGSWTAPAGMTFNKFTWNNTLTPNISGAIALTGDPIFLMPTSTPPIPPAGKCNCLIMAAKLKQGTRLPVWGKKLKLCATY